MKEKRRFDKFLIQTVLAEAIRKREKQKDQLLKRSKITYTISEGTMDNDKQFNRLTKEIDILLNHYQDITDDRI